MLHADENQSPDVDASCEDADYIIWCECIYDYTKCECEANEAMSVHARVFLWFVHK